MDQTMINLSKRCMRLELIDTESPDLKESNIFLKELELINKLILSYPPTLAFIKDVFKIKHVACKQPIRILDVGSGYGDMLRKIFYWTSKNNIPVDLTGVDINPGAEKAAKSVTPKGMNINYITKDIFEADFKETYDIIISSLFTHHLEEESIVKFVQWMCRHANYGWFINDLHRHLIPYYFIKYFVRSMNFNKLIINDAPLSVARSFKRNDWERILEKAKTEPSKLSISWRWPFRYCVSCLI